MPVKVIKHAVGCEDASAHIPDNRINDVNFLLTNRAEGMPQWM